MFYCGSLVKVFVGGNLMAGIGENLMFSIICWRERCRSQHRIGHRRVEMVDQWNMRRFGCDRAPHLLRIYPGVGSNLPVVYVSSRAIEKVKGLVARLLWAEELMEHSLSGILRDLTPELVSPYVIHLYPGETRSWQAPSPMSPIRNIAEAARSLALYGHSPD